MRQVILGAAFLVMAAGATKAGQPDTLSPNDQMSYQGQYAISTTIAQPLDINNLSLGSVLQQALNTKTEKNNGDISISFIVSGSTVSANVSGTGGIIGRVLSGNVRNGICHLTSADGNGTAIYDGPCDRTRFSGTIKGTTAEGHNYRGTFTAMASGDATSGSNGYSSVAASSRNTLSQNARAIGPDLVLPPQYAAGTRVYEVRNYPGNQRVSLDVSPQSAAFAARLGIIWSYGFDVYPNFQYGRAWFVEAQRRQQLSRDFASQKSITYGVQDYADYPIIKLLQMGQQKGVQGDWMLAKFYFGRAADQGDIQGMAALGYTYIEKFSDLKAGTYWCQQAFLKTRIEHRNFELDTVNHFCPESTFSSLMTPKERVANRASVARARAESDQIRVSAEKAARIAREIVAEWGRAPVGKPGDDPGGCHHLSGSGGCVAAGQNPSGDPAHDPD